MTWEGWFRILSPPKERSVVFGTAGANHDGNQYDLAHRRRYANVWLDTDGSVSMSTNVGISFGEVKAEMPATVADGRWHHYAALFKNQGGAKVTVWFTIYNLQIGKYEFRPVEREILWNTILTTVGRVGRNPFAPNGMTYEFIDTRPVYYPDDQRSFSVGVTCITSAEEAEEMRRTFATALVEYVEKDLQALDIIDLGLFRPPWMDRDTFGLYVESMGLPTLNYTGIGTAELYVDGIRGKGTIIHAPYVDIGGIPVLEDIALDGQMVLCGGHLGRIVDCDLGTFRLWSKALSVEQIEKIREKKCSLPDLQNLVGGDFPYHLEATFGTSYVNNSAGTEFGWLRPVGGSFERGGMCDERDCAQFSPDGCPLQRSVPFDSLEKCDSFVGWNSCKVAGASRGRASSTHLMGCHAGAAPRKLPEWGRPLSEP
jgi:hypothetical protein